MSVCIADMDASLWSDGDVGDAIRACVCVCVTIGQTIAPTVPLTKELESLYEFLLHQKVVHGSNDRDYNGDDHPNGTCSIAAQVNVSHTGVCVPLLELMQLSEKELETKMRDLENWNFRLNLDEGSTLLRLACGEPLWAEYCNVYLHAPSFVRSKGD